MTSHLQLTPEILKEMHYHRSNHPAPLVQRRMEALWLKGHGLAHVQIAERVDVPESKLNAYVTSLEAHFRDNPSASIKEAQSEIETITGVKRSETQIAEFLKKNSISVVEK